MPVPVKYGKLDGGEICELPEAVPRNRFVDVDAGPNATVVFPVPRSGRHEDGLQFPAPVLSAGPPNTNVGIGVPVGVGVGLAFGDADGLALGDADGLADGDADGLALGDADGLADGDADGLAVGDALVAGVGEAMGAGV